MPKLKEAMQEQINRMTAEEEIPSLPNTEIRNLLEAFISLINAYLQRLGSENLEEEPGKKWPQVSDTFGSLG